MKRIRVVTEQRNSSFWENYLDKFLLCLSFFPFIEFLKYKMDKPSSALGALSGDAVVPSEPGVSGLLWVHLLAGRGLRSTASSSAATTPSTPSGPPIGK